MSYVRKKGDKTKFWVVNSQCVGCPCFRPGHYQVMGAVGNAGYRNTGRTDPTCMRNAYHGCPTDPGYSKELERERKAEGWKNV